MPQLFSALRVLGRHTVMKSALVGEVLNLSGSGTVTAPGATGCSFTLTGTARVVGDAIQLDYAGSTCLGPVSGTEILLQV